jgi:hypothetical protein
MMQLEENIRNWDIIRTFRNLDGSSWQEYAKLPARNL